MGRVFDFAKRRIAGYIVFWILVLLSLGTFSGNDPPAQAGALFILVIAFICSLLYTRRLKRKQRARREGRDAALRIDRKSTRLNSSHDQISYAVFCLKKKKHDLTIGPLTRSATPRWTRYIFAHTVLIQSTR